MAMRWCSAKRNHPLPRGFINLDQREGAGSLRLPKLPTVGSRNAAKQRGRLDPGSRLHESSLQRISRAGRPLQDHGMETTLLSIWDRTRLRTSEALRAQFTAISAAFFLRRD